MPGTLTQRLAEVRKSKRIKVKTLRGWRSGMLWWWFGCEACGLIGQYESCYTANNAARKHLRDEHGWVR